MDGKFPAFLKCFFFGVGNCGVKVIFHVLFRGLFLKNFVRFPCLFVSLFVCLFVKYPLFSHTYSVILFTLHVILPSTLMYFGSRLKSWITLVMPREEKENFAESETLGSTLVV